MENYISMKLEFLALKWAVTEKLKVYLLWTPFKVFTDNKQLCKRCVTGRREVRRRRAEMGKSRNCTQNNKIRVETTGRQPVRNAQNTTTSNSTHRQSANQYQNITMAIMTILMFGRKGGCLQARKHHPNCEARGCWARRNVPKFTQLIVGSLWKATRNV
jgi:hypothetical protein